MSIPRQVKDFLAANIESVAQLEVLLLLRAAPEKRWTADEVARALVSDLGAAQRWLEDLVRREIALKKGDAYGYDPPEELQATLDDLAESYAKYRVTVIGLIFAKPSGRISLFSDAFRIRKDR